MLRPSGGWEPVEFIGKLHHETMQLEFGEWLRHRRRVLDLTQEDLAKRAACSIHTIRKIESGDLKPSRELGLALAGALVLVPQANEAFVHFARTPSATAPADAFSEPDPIPSSGVPAASKPPEKFHLPAPLTAVLGREHETSVVVKLLRLPKIRLVTLTGPPGTGKTRLAMAVARELQEELADGAAFVPLASLAHAALVEKTIAKVLNVRESASIALSAALRTFLREKQLLLVLDNLEHLLTGENGAILASSVSELLTHAPRLAILTTSREPLGVYGEREIPVAPLTVPSLAPLPQWHELQFYPAIQLFVERAQAVEPGFELTAQNAAAVARLSVGLDGLPLAIELAAARIKHDSPQNLLQQWDRRFDLYNSGMRDHDARQRTLRGAMDWSYELLDPQAQRVFRYLGAFRGGFTIAAADAVCGFATGSIVESLVEKSLVTQENPDRVPPRFGLLETLREYALDKLQAADNVEAAFQRHMEFFTALAQQVQTDTMHGVTNPAVRDLEREQDNVRSALDWSATTGRGGQTVTLAAAMAEYWLATQGIVEGIGWLRQVLSMNLPKTAEFFVPRARVQTMYADFLRISGELRAARPLLEQAISDLQQAGAVGRPLLGFALGSLSRLALWQGDGHMAHDTADRALALAVELDDRYGRAGALRRIGEWALSRFDYSYAFQCLDEALRYDGADSTHFGRAVSLLERGDIARAMQDYTRARRDYQAAFDANRTLHNKIIQYRIEHRLGLVTALEGEPERGEAMITRALQFMIQQGIGSNLPFVFTSLALCAAVRGQTKQAMQRLGFLDGELERMQMVLSGPDALEYDRTLRLVREQANPDQLAKWRTEGRALHMQDLFGNSL